MTPTAYLRERLTYHLELMEAWADGQRSWTNYGPDAPYTPDVIARMDAAEVEKHASAVRGYVAALAAKEASR